jgi:hypothetical protein
MIDTAGTNIWTAQGLVGLGDKVWSSITSNSDGTKLAASTDYGGDIWRIDTAGTNIWTTQGLSNNWVSIRSTSDGTKIVAGTNNGYIWMLNNNGVTWTNQNVGVGIDVAITMNSDGTKLAASVYSGNIYIGYGVEYPTTISIRNGLTTNFSYIGLTNILDNTYTLTNNIDPSTVLSTITGGGNTTYAFLNVLFDTGGVNTLTITDTTTDTVVDDQITITITLTCFLQGTTILTDHGYVPIEHLKKGDFVSTYLHGFVPIELIGKKNINHISCPERIPEQLYTCSSEQFPELHDDLVITGCHSILVDDFKEGQREKTSDLLGKIYVTDNKYRLPACVDDRTHVYKHPGTYTIYHIALEHSSYYKNYGVYANGLLVETSSIRYLKELSNMELL